MTNWVKMFAIFDMLISLIFKRHTDINKKHFIEKLPNDAKMSRCKIYQMMQKCKNYQMMQKFTKEIHIEKKNC